MSKDVIVIFEIELEYAKLVLQRSAPLTLRKPALKMLISVSAPLQLLLFSGSALVFKTCPHPQGAGPGGQIFCLINQCSQPFGFRVNGE